MNNIFNIGFQNAPEEAHLEYLSMVKDWELINLCIKGERFVKAVGEKLLPYPIPIDDNKRNQEDFKKEYAIYLDRAVFVDYTKQAVKDLVAGVFRKPPLITDIPKELEYIPTTQLARKIVSYLTAYGRCFAIADYPKTEGVPSLLEERENNLFAYITIYNPINVISWDTQRVGGEEVLTKVVVREDLWVEQLDKDDKLTVVWRIFKIENGTYLIENYNQYGELIERVQPRANGQLLTRIPGLFFGVETNTPEVDEPPITGIANTNIKHYQTWAEIKNIERTPAHPTVAITGAPAGFIDKMREEDISIDIAPSRALILEGDTADAKILEGNYSNLMHYKTLQELEKAMLDMGARLRSNQSTAGAETAEAIKLRNAGDISTMASIATQAEQGLKELIEYCALYMGVSLPESFSITLNKEFVREEPDPNIMAGLGNLVASGKLPVRILYDYLKNTGLMSEEEDPDNLIEEAQQEPIGLPIYGGAAE